VFARALGRLPKQRARASALEATNSADAADEARNIIARTLESDAETLATVLALAPNDKNLETKIEGLVDQLSGAWLLLTGKLTEQRKGNRVVFTLEAKESPKDQKPRNPKEASRPRSVDYRRVPVRKVTGPMNIYYYDYVTEHAAGDLRAVERFSARPDGSIIMYEILNLVDGKRSVQAIRDYLTVAYGSVAVEDVADYLRLLEKIGVVRMEG
jgi:hypothetical protein